MGAATVKLKDLFAIFAFCLVLRGLGQWFVRANLENEDVAFNASIIVDCLMNFAVLALCIRQFKLRAPELRGMVGTSTLKLVLFAAALGAVLLAFTVGTNAFEVWMLAQADEIFAYRLWPLHNIADIEDGTFDQKIALTLLSGAVLAPVVEEFFFRGLLFPTVALRTGVHKAAIWSSLVFVSLHLRHPHLVETFVFSLSLSYLYCLKKSLVLCAVAHGTYNAITLLVENTFRSYLTRGPDGLGEVQNWSGEFAVFALSGLLLTYWAHTCRAELAKQALESDRENSLDQPADRPW